MSYSSFFDRFALRGARKSRPARRSARPRRRAVTLEPLEARRVMAAGELDPSFGVDFGNDGIADGQYSKQFEVSDEFFQAVGQQSDGKLVFAGRSNVPGEGFDVIVARLGTDGLVDTSFGDMGYTRVAISGSQEIRDMAIDGLDRIVVVGESSSLVGSENHLFAIRLSADGTHDTSFDSDAGDGVTGVAMLPHAQRTAAHAVAIDASGNILVAGQIHNLSSTNPTDFLVGRFLPTGQADTSFGAGGLVTTNVAGRADTATDVAVDANGNVLVTGMATPSSGLPRMAVARYLANGQPDNTFAPVDSLITAENVATVSSVDFGFSNRSVSSSSFAIDPLGRIVTVGIMTNSSLNDLVMARLTAAGTLDTSFAVGGALRINIDAQDAVGLLEGPAVALEPPDPEGEVKIVIGSSVGPDTTANKRFAVARITKTGQLDSSFDGDGIVTTDFVPQGGAVDTFHRLHDVIVQGDGRIVAGGGVWYVDNLTSPGPQSFRLAAARYLSDLGNAPVAEAGGPYLVAEGGIVPLDAGGSFQPGDPGENLTFAWDLDGDGLFGETGPAAGRGDEVGALVTFEAVDLNEATDLTVRVKATNERGLWHYDTATISILTNVPPTIDVVNPSVAANEGATAGNTGAFSDSNGDPVTLSASIGAVVDNGDGTWTWTYTTGDGPSDSQSVTITAEDIGGLEDSVTFDLVVDNVVPTADAGGPYETVAGTPITLDASASSDPVDALSYQWDFDQDGEFDDATGVNPTYDPAANGIAPGGAGIVSVQVSDGDGGTDIATTTVSVTGTGVFLSNGTLFAIGTTGSDSVSMQIVNGQLVVQSALLPGGSASFDPADVNVIVVQAGDGDDVVSIATNVTIDVQVDGGAGDDLLMSGGGNDLVLGGSGNDLLLTQAGDDVAIGGSGGDFVFTGTGNDAIIGGEGADQLFGGGGFDLIIGGTESDFLFGGAGEDILIGPSTVYDDYDTPEKTAAIDDIMSIWTSPTTYEWRVGELTNSGGLLDPATTIFNDDDTDVYLGGNGNDLYFADLDSSGNDDFLVFATVREEAFLL